MIALFAPPVAAPWLRVRGGTGVLGTSRRRHRRPRSRVLVTLGVAVAVRVTVAVVVVVSAGAGVCARTALRRQIDEVHNVGGEERNRKRRTDVIASGAEHACCALKRSADGAHQDDRAAA